MRAKVAFNPDQLATWNQARKYAKRINGSVPFKQAGISIPADGIYLPSWVSGPGGDPEPSGPDGLMWLHYKFSNGMDGVNVGLVVNEFQRYPAAPLYVFNWLLAQVKGA